MNDLIQNKNIVEAFIPVKQKCVQKTVWIMDNVSDYPITKKSLEELNRKIKKQMRRKKKKYNKLEKRENENLNKNKVFNQSVNLKKKNLNLTG
jgi:hypothetical protein